MTKEYNNIHFEPFPKIGRVFKHAMIISEKLDGTNGQIVFDDSTPFEATSNSDPNCVWWFPHEGKTISMFVGSRNRYITPEKDNYGFAKWVVEHKEELWAKLGIGRHFGEWWGKGIQRGYGQTTKRFSLFNTSRWSNDDQRPACCGVVPVLYIGAFDTKVIKEVLEELKQTGSKAAPGVMDVEGIVVFHLASNTLWKYTVDDNHKSGDAQTQGDLINEAESTPTE